MTRETIEAHLAAALADIAPEVSLAAIRRDANLREELDIDSMDFLRLVRDIDTRLGVAIPEADYAKVATLDALVAYLGARVQ